MMDVALGYFEEDDVGFDDDDMEKPPSCGVEYLKRVQYEASQCPDVVIAPYPLNDAWKEPSQLPPATKIASITDSPDLPNESIQVKIAADFAFLRQTFIRFKSKQKGKKISGKSLPNKNDISTWYVFCFGNSFSNSTEDNNVNGDQGDSASSSGNPPLLGILSGVNQPLAVKLLEYHMTWLTTRGFSTKQGHWLFALLLCIDKPTPPDVIYSLRRISRKCSELCVKAAINEDKEVLHQLYLFVILVSKYFGQADLAL